MAKRTAPNTTVIHQRNARIYDANTGKWRDAKDTSQQAQDFMTDLGNYFESLNVSKDVRETTTSFYLGLLGMERNLFELGIKQVMDQIETGAENIDNPLLGGFLGDLGYLEYYAPSLYDYFDDMFGENKTLDRSEVLTNFGIDEDPVTPEEGGTFTSEQLVGRYNDSPAAQDFGVFVTYDPATNTFIEDVSSFGFEGDAATKEYTPEEFMERLGVEGSFEETQVDPEAEEEVEEAGDSEGWTWVNPDPEEIPRVFLNRRQLIDFNSGKDVVLSDGTVINNTNSEIIGGGAGGGMWVSPTGLEAEVERPEGTVNLEDLTEEQISTFWPEIKEALGELSDTVKDVVFGTSGPPTSVGDLLEDISEGIMEGLKGPIAVTFDPWEGITLDLKIPVGFEISGTSIQIPIFDADGNLVPVDEIKQVFIDAKDRIWAATGGVLQQVGSIFTDGKGNIVLDVIDAGQAILEGVGLGEDGALVGTLVGAAIGELQYDPGTGEILEEGSIEDIGLDAGEEDGLADTVDDGNDVVDRDEPEVTPLTGPDDPEELTPKPLTPPKGSQYIDDKAGNIVRAIGPDGTVYNVDENGEWSVSTSDVVTEGETTVLPGETTIGDGTTDDDEQVDAGSPYQDGSAADDFYGSFPVDTGGVDDRGDDVVDRDDPEVTPLTDADTPEELTEDVIDDDSDNGQPPLTNGGDNGGDGGGDDGGDNGQPPLTNGGGDVNDGQTPEEPPLVGPPGKDGVDGVDGVDGAAGAAGAAGAPARSRGYMGGLSYELPQFVGVQYQPKDYTVELDRIINESLFKGMI